MHSCVMRPRRGRVSGGLRDERRPRPHHDIPRARSADNERRPQ